MNTNDTKIIIIGRGTRHTANTVMVFVNGKYVGTCEKSAVKTYLKVMGIN